MVIIASPLCVDVVADCVCVVVDGDTDVVAIAVTPVFSVCCCVAV